MTYLESINARHMPRLSREFLVALIDGTEQYIRASSPIRAFLYVQVAARDYNECAAPIDLEHVRRIGIR